MLSNGGGVVRSRLNRAASLILTDSGGVQGEGCVLRVPCVMSLRVTERPVTVDVEANILADTPPSRIVRCTEIILGRENNWINPFGDGKAGERILQVVTNN